MLTKTIRFMEKVSGTRSSNDRVPDTFSIKRIVFVSVLRAPTTIVSVSV
jgi:hypothetical protein